MKVKVLYFAVLRDLIGWGEEIREVSAGATAGSVWLEIRRATPALDGWSNAPLLAVNEEYAAEGKELSEGDELALIPPVAGG